MEQINKESLRTWRADVVTRSVLQDIAITEQEVIDGIVVGNYKTFAEIEKARGIILGLRMVIDIIRGE